MSERNNDSGCMTEVIAKGSLKQRRFSKPKLAELTAFANRRTWKEVSRNDFPQNFNILGGQLVLDIENNGQRN